MNPQVDVAAVIRKLQDRLGEALTTIAILETHIDKLTAEVPASDKNGESAIPEVPA